MVFRIIYRIIYGFIGNERIIERLSESYPIRRAAQLASYVLLRSQKSIKDNLNNKSNQEFIADVKHKTTDNPLTRFSERLFTEFRNELNNAKEELKRSSKR